jgi:glycosyltransferase involved in cell wall biosynthesis
MSPNGTALAVVPAYNEARTVGGVIRALREHAPHYEVLVVDDGSTDRTGDLAERAGARVLRLPFNVGIGGAVQAGFVFARESGYRCLVQVDADGQHDPAEIPAFLARFEARRPELIIGQRDLGSMPPVRRASNTLGGLLLGAALGRSVPDNQSGFRLVGRTLMGALLDSDESGFEFEVEMIARCIALGLPIDAVPIRTIYDGAPSHIKPVHHLREFVRVTRKARRIAHGG